MRAAAMSVWVFINLLCFGMCGYLYLIWSQYWLYIEKQRLFSKSPSTPQRTMSGSNLQEPFDPKKFDLSVAINSSALRYDAIKKRSAVGSFWGTGKLAQMLNRSSGNQARPSTNVVRKSQGRPRFPNIHKPLLEFDSEKYVCDDMLTDICGIQTSEFKELLLKEFHRVLISESKVFRSGLDSQNHYAVKYKSERRTMESRQHVLCALGQIGVNTVTSEDQPFKRLGYHIPEHPLQSGRAYNSCAVVTSAGALLGSHLGEFIDAHEMVLRFNNAPTENYTDDVGSKTTFRILNSQVVTKSEFKFLENPLYRDVSILIWDPANYSSTLEEWYQNPDFQVFPVYKKLLESRRNPDVHLLKPQVLWKLWRVLQDSSQYRLRRNPPSSGFIGIWFALHRCKRVRVFEYVPSARASLRCHYHVQHDDAACTMGSWHPLAQEKALAERIRDNPDVDVFQRGFIEIPGVNTVKCP